MAWRKSADHTVDTSYFGAIALLKIRFLVLSRRKRVAGAVTCNKVRNAFLFLLRSQKSHVVRKKKPIPYFLQEA